MGSGSSAPKITRIRGRTARQAPRAATMPLLAGFRFRRPWSTPCPALCPQVARRLEGGMPTPGTGAPGRGGWALFPQYRTWSCPVRAVVCAVRLLDQPLSHPGGEDTRPVLPLLPRSATPRPSFSVSLRQSFWLRVCLSVSLPASLSLSLSSFLLLATSGPPPSSLSLPLLCYISLYLLRSPPLLLCPPPPPLLPRSLPPQPLKFLSALQLLFLPFLPPPPHPLLPFQCEASRNTHTHTHTIAHMLLDPALSRGLPH